MRKCTAPRTNVLSTYSSCPYSVPTTRSTCIYTWQYYPAILYRCRLHELYTPSSQSCNKRTVSSTNCTVVSNNIPLGCYTATQKVRVLNEIPKVHFRLIPLVLANIHQINYTVSQKHSSLLTLLLLHRFWYNLGIRTVKLIDCLSRQCTRTFSNTTAKSFS